MKKLFLIYILILFSTSTVHASEPSTILKGEISQVFGILNDPVYSDDSKKDEQHDKLWKDIECCEGGFEDSFRTTVVKRYCNQ